MVGLDTLAHVINTMRDTLPDDAWHAHFAVPESGAFVAALRSLSDEPPVMEIFLGEAVNPADLAKL